MPAAGMFENLSAYSLAGGERMALDEEQKIKEAAHAIRLEQRERLLITGVEDVAGFDENLVVLTTALGELTVRGQGLHMEKIDLDAGQLALRGKLSELSYDDNAPSGGWWSRLFG